MISDASGSGLQTTVKVISIATIVIAQIIYLVKLSKKTDKFKPTVISWFGWAILMGVSFAAQLGDDGFTINLASLLISAVGCFTIFFSAFLIYKWYTFEKKDLRILFIGLFILLLYQFFSDPWLITILAILVDLIFAIPLIRNANRDPEKEKAFSWVLAFVSWIFTLVMLTFNFSWIQTLWPIYLILFNGALTYLTYIKPRIVSNAKQQGT